MGRSASRLTVVLLALAASSHVGAAGPTSRELAYGQEPSQRLDLFVPDASRFPTVVFVHGGSLTSGDKADEDYRGVCAPLVAAGIACANANYRLAPGVSWPVPAEDVADAVAWVRSNIGTRGGDPDALFLFGHSSGAMLVAVVGTDERYLARRGLKTADLGGVIAMGSIMWDEELEQALTLHGRDRVEAAFLSDTDGRIYGSLETYLEHWPIRHVRSGLPPFLFLIADGEREQPPVLETNRKFVEDARASGNSADYRVLAGRTHFSAIREFGASGDPAFAAVRDFVRRSGSLDGP